MSTTTQTHLMTVAEFMKIDDEPNRHELIKGELLTMPPPGYPHGTVTIRLSLLLGNYVEIKNLGVLTSGSGFKLESDPDTVLAPDISFIPRDRVGILPDGYYPGPPDLAIEIVSPSDSKPAVARKTSLWLELGAKSVWNVNPRKRTVEVVRADGVSHLLHDTDELVDDTVPGFRVKVSEIFE